MTPHMSGPSLADKRTVDESKPTSTVDLIFVGDVLEYLDFKLCRNALPVFLSHLDEPECWLNRCRSGSEMMNRPCGIHKNTHVKMDRISSDNSLTTFEESSTAGSKMVTAISNRDANANAVAMSNSSMVAGLICGLDTCRAPARELERAMGQKMSGPRLELRTYCAHMSVRQL